MKRKFFFLLDFILRVVSSPLGRSYQDRSDTLYVYQNKIKINPFGSGAGNKRGTSTHRRSVLSPILRVDRRDGIVVSRLQPRNGGHVSHVATVIMLPAGKWSGWKRIWPVDHGCTSKNRSMFVQIGDTRRFVLSREVRYYVCVSISCIPIKQVESLGETFSDLLAKTIIVHRNYN